MLRFWYNRFMKLSLAVSKFINADIEYNLAKIKEAYQRNDDVDMVCFAESFLQGFDALDFNFEHDKRIAISQDDLIIKELCRMTKGENRALSFGYFELCLGKIYSSYMTIFDGEIINNYRRITKTWKDYRYCDEHYDEGKEIREFHFMGHDFMIALCGDLFLKQRVSRQRGSCFGRSMSIFP